VFNFGMTHESQIRAADANTVHELAGVRVPAYQPDTPEVRSNWAQYYDRITQLDSAVAEALSALEQAELSEDTIVFFFSDHGSGFPRSKRWPFNSGLHVPMIVYFPEKWRHLAPAEYAPGVQSERLVDFMDLAPTLLSLIGREPPAYLHGHAFPAVFKPTHRTISTPSEAAWMSAMTWCARCRTGAIFICVNTCLTRSMVST
jgi:uncharacterized sulfatase